MAGSRKDVRRRLRDAALELYAERGYDRTTTAQVAIRAGVTERTYFRHFPDKREVIFDGEGALRSALTEAVADAPDLAPLAVLRHAFLSLVPYFESDRNLQQRQEQVISSAPELRERGATKLAHLTEALTGALEQRGTARPVASLAATCGIGVLTRVRHDWLAGSPDGQAALLTAAFDDLVRLIGGPEKRPAAPPAAKL